MPGKGECAAAALQQGVFWLEAIIMVISRINPLYPAVVELTLCNVLPPSPLCQHLPDNYLLCVHWNIYPAFARGWFSLLVQSVSRSLAKGAHHSPSVKKSLQQRDNWPFPSHWVFQQDPCLSVPWGLRWDVKASHASWLCLQKAWEVGWKALKLFHAEHLIYI